MATINNISIFVESEEVSYGVEATSHPVEYGIDITDHVRRKPCTLSLSGEIVGNNASNKTKTIIALHQKGALCRYSGRTFLSNCIIEDFSISNTYDIWGGCKFSMVLKEIRTAGAAYNSKTKATTKAGTQQVKSGSTSSYVIHTVKKGDCVWNLVAASKAPYKNLKRPAIDGKTYSACDWVMKMNPNAFSRKGDFRTLQINAKLIVGCRNTRVSSTRGGIGGSAKNTVSSLN